MLCRFQFEFMLVQQKVLELNSTWPIKDKDENIYKYKLKYSEFLL